MGPGCPRIFFVRILDIVRVFLLSKDTFMYKIENIYSRKVQKSHQLGKFTPKMGPGCPRNFFYKFWTLSLCFLYQKTLSCKKSKKSNDPISRKLRKSHFLGKFGPKMGPGCPRKFFFKNRAPSHSRIHENLSSCKKLEKTNDPISRKTHNRRTDGQGSIYRTLPLSGRSNNKSSF